MGFEQESREAYLPTGRCFAGASTTATISQLLLDPKFAVAYADLGTIYGNGYGHRRELIQQRVSGSNC